MSRQYPTSGFEILITIDRLAGECCGVVEWKLLHESEESRSSEFTTACTPLSKTEDYENDNDQIVSAMACFRQYRRTRVPSLINSA
ncbi:MAG: hypothetical protein WCC85_02285, partial [Candidatus Sulfotelmatobacter sp.]